MTTRPPSGEQHVLVHGDQVAIAVAVGGGLRSYAVAGREVLDGYPEERRCTDARGQLLVPYSNRLRGGRYTWDGAEYQLPLSEPARGGSIHGLGRWLSWTAVEQDAARVVLRTRLAPQSGWPFDLDVEVEHALGDDGLSVTTSAVNRGAQPAPFASGAHPYLWAGAGELVDALDVTAPGAAELLAGDDGIPTGRRDVTGTDHDLRGGRRLGPLALDTGFTALEREADGRAWVRVRRPDGLHVELWLDAVHTHLMLFTGDGLPDAARRRQGIGVEPMTAPPNALATGEDLRILAPGERTRAAWGLRAG